MACDAIAATVLRNVSCPSLIFHRPNGDTAVLHHQLPEGNIRKK